MSTVANEVVPPVAPPGSGADPDQPRDPRRTIAGRYEIEPEPPLGIGGMALVHRGKDLRTRRDVAVKTLRPEYRDDPETRARFRREARLLAFLSHPNVVRVFDFVEDHGASWVVLERLPGRSVKDLLAERGPFPPAEVARVLDQAAAALAHLHARGLVHLDVKPQNLQVAEDGRIKLIDFGLAQPVASVQQASDGRTFGTAAYLAPEQACGEPVGVATDVYALGCVVYELLTGRPPFGAGKPENPKNDLIRARLERVPTAPSRVRPDLRLPRWIDDVVLWALAREPAARYASVESFAKVFRAGVEGERVVDIGTTGRVPAVEVTSWPPEAAARGDVTAAGAKGGTTDIPLASRILDAGMRRLAGLRRGLWRAVAAVGVVDAALAIVLFITQGAIPGLYEPEARLGPGASASVIVQDWRVRDAPGLSGTALWALDAGERVEITGAAVTGEDGGRWWPVAVARESGTATGYMSEAGIAAERPTPLDRLREAVGLD